MAEKKLFLLDGHALVYRAHFAFIGRPLINSKGLNTSAITGFVRTLWDLLKNQKPTHLAVFFDLDTPTFRHQIFPEYKANREAQPEDITTALPYIRKIVKGFNIPIVEMEGFEADDVIGTIAKKAEKQGFTVFMVTPDKDFSQLVSENIFLYKPSRMGNGVDILGIKEITQKWDIENIDQVIDVLGLKGDKVDNIPGIPGIGDKTASRLLKQYGSIENILAHTNDLKGKLKENLETYGEQGLLSKKLATIDTEVNVDFDAVEFQISDINRDELVEIFKDLEFRALAQVILAENETKNKSVQKDLFGNPVKSAKTPTKKYSVANRNINNTDHKYTLVDTLPKLEDLVRRLEQKSAFAIDTETTSIDPNLAELVGISISFNKNEAYYIPIPENPEETRQILQKLQPLLENDRIEKIGQNIKYDMLVFRWHGQQIHGQLFDTMIAHYLLEPESRHKLDLLSETYLDYKMIPIDQLIGKRTGKQLSMRDIEVEKVCEYAAEDADITFQIRDIFDEKLQELEVKSLFQKLEIPLVRVLAEMEYNGIHVDTEFLKNYSQQLGNLILESERSIYKKAGVDFNIASPRQVGEVLFDRLKLPYRWRRTPTGQYSTDEDKLNELALKFDIVKDIQNHRKLSKLKSTYVDALPNMVNPKTGRIHSSFNQARAATGRLSSENPNLQNIPIRDEAGREIRKSFIPRDQDHLLLSADYSQIELRLIAELSKEEAMLDAFSQGLDIHLATASKVYGVPLDQVTADQRRNAKTVNFSIIYGAGATNLSRQLGIKRPEATLLIQNYFKTYQGLKKYMEEVVQFARDHGYVSTVMGRKRFLRDINSRNGLARSNAERMAINTPVQGSAADMIKAAMINIHREMQNIGLRSKMILQVHDELVFDAHRSELESLKEIVEYQMKNALPGLKVPIVIGMGEGTNWLEAH